MTVTNLQPETAYSITVAAYTMKGDGARSKPKVVVTKGAGARPSMAPLPSEHPCRVLEPLWGGGGGGGRTKQEEQGEQKCGAAPEDIKTQCGPAPLSSSQMETFNSQLLPPHPLPPVPPAWIPFSGLAVSSAPFGSLVSQHLLRKPSPLTPTPQSWSGRTPPAPSTPCLAHPSSDHPR